MWSAVISGSPPLNTEKCMNKVDERLGEGCIVLERGSVKLV